ncbi:MAG TPA: hypothetical protein VH063_06690 [Gaiellaceae bacterium]|nr:hypothetical protein [Gaiellaceae bacterium]
MRLRPLPFAALVLLAAAFAAGSRGATPRPSLQTPGQCEAGIELTGAPRFFCNLISFAKPAGWALRPSNQMLVAAPGAPTSKSSFTVTTGARSYPSFSSFAAVETPVAKRLLRAGGAHVLVQRETLSAGDAIVATANLPDGSTHVVIALLFHKVPYVISAVAASAVDLADVDRMIASADFGHPAGLANHLELAMDWKQTAYLHGGAVGSVAASNLEIGNRHWSLHVTLANPGRAAVRVNGIALFRYVPTYLANPAGYTSISTGSRLVPRPAGFDRRDGTFMLRAGQTWTGEVEGTENIAQPDQFVRIGTGFAPAASGTPVSSPLFGPLLGAPAAA